MKETNTWLRRPRYTPLELGTFMLIAMATMSITAAWSMRLLHNATFTSPLPQVIAAKSTDPTGSAAYQKNYHFTTDWFTARIPTWNVVLEPYRGKPHVNYLEVGAYEGGSLLWMLENVLTDPTARATAIDIFDGPYKDNYSANLELSRETNKVTTIADYSQLVLRRLPFDSFDIVYIDGSHQKADVLEDAVLAWRLLRSGGLMIFDDYQYADRIRGEIVCPKMAIDPFVQCFESRCEVVHNEYQLIIRKTR